MFGSPVHVTLNVVSAKFTIATSFAAAISTERMAINCDNLKMYFSQH